MLNKYRFQNTCEDKNEHQNFFIIYYKMHKNLNLVVTGYCYNFLMFTILVKKPVNLEFISIHSINLFTDDQTNFQVRKYFYTFKNNNSELFDMGTFFLVFINI